MLACSCNHVAMFSCSDNGVVGWGVEINSLVDVISWLVSGDIIKRLMYS